MPAKTFYLDESHKEAIVMKWGLLWKNFTVLKDGEVIGQLNGTQALEQGGSFTLPDGRTITVKLNRKYIISQGLDVLLDGHTLPGSHTHPQQQFKQALYALLFLIIVNVLFGVLAYLPGLEILQEIGLGSGSILTGLIYAGLAYWAKSKISAVALYTALGLFVIDFIASIVLTSTTGVNPTAGVFMRILICLLLYSGAQAARVLRGQQLAATSIE
jgi:hypothetical protein